MHYRLCDLYHLRIQRPRVSGHATGYEQEGTNKSISVAEHIVFHVLSFPYILHPGIIQVIQVHSYHIIIIYSFIKLCQDAK